MKISIKNDLLVGRFRTQMKKRSSLSKTDTEEHILSMQNIPA